MCNNKITCKSSRSGKKTTTISVAEKSKLTSPKASRREPLSTRLAEKPLGEDAVALENAVSGQTTMRLCVLA